MRLNDNLVKLIQRVRAAVDRGDMFVGTKDEFPGDVALFARLLDLRIGVFDGRVLLKLPTPREGMTRDGSVVQVVSYYDGVYYGVSGAAYREKDISWKREKKLPGCV